MMTDPIADMLTRVRNASRIERPYVDMPATYLKARVAQVLKDEGFVLEDLGHVDLQVRGRHVHGRALDAVGVADAREHVRQRVGHHGLGTLTSWPS